jgi:hypothetical protein
LPGPTATLGFILATLYGAIFHFIVGGDARRLALFLLSAWVGFTLGHLLGVLFEIDILNIGTLRIVAATFGALVALGASYILTSGQVRKRSKR